MTPLRVCVYHRTMGPEIVRAVQRRGLDAVVDVVHDTAVDPPHRDELDVLLANTFPDGLLGRCPRLRWLHLTGTGVEHVALGEPRPDLLVTNSATVPAGAVAEFAWMALLAFAKDALRLADQQRQRVWALPDARGVAGSRLLLLGLGRVGTEIARRAAAFDVSVTAVTRHGRPSPLAERVLPPAGLVPAATEADHLVIALPGTPATRGLVDRRVLRALPRSAVVVNVGRSSVLDTDALARALQAGGLRGALLDVHDEEPLPPDSPLWTVPNLWLTPHCAYRFPEEEQEVGRLFADNLAAFATGAPVRNVVDLAAILGQAARPPGIPPANGRTPMSPESEPGSPATVGIR
jgi:phosphoglycerate dehydrogenase-like enzyme